MRICMYGIFCPKTDRPLIVGVRNSVTGATVIYDLYVRGSGRTLFEIEQDEIRIRKLILGANRSELTIVTSSWKEYLKHFNLPLCKERYKVYDISLSTIDIPNPDRARKAIAAVLERMCTCKLYGWQQVLADAAVVYEDWEKTGVLHGGLLKHPGWSQHTSTGRSKCKRFNIQGLDKQKPEHISRPGGLDGEALVLFDWISADVRFAGLFSGDDVLDDSFAQSDPYQFLAEKLGVIDELGLDDASEVRDSCKLAMLKGINSMDTDSIVFQVYPKLGKWIDTCRARLCADDGYMDTFLGRRFWIRDKKSSLKVFNGCMQGSVAHAMQLVIRRIWEELRGYLLAEIHDSLVVACPRDRLDEVIGRVSAIMLYPFQELYDSGLINVNPSFPFRVYVGELWHGWELRETHRCECVEQMYNDSKHTMSIDAPTRGEINGWFQSI